MKKHTTRPTLCPEGRHLVVQRCLRCNAVLAKHTSPPPKPSDPSETPQSPGCNAATEGTLEPFEALKVGFMQLCKQYEQTGEQLKWMSEAITIMMQERGQTVVSHDTAAHTAEVTERR